MIAQLLAEDKDGSNQSVKLSKASKVRKYNTSKKFYDYYISMHYMFKDPLIWQQVHLKSMKKKVKRCKPSATHQQHSKFAEVSEY